MLRFYHNRELANRLDIPLNRWKRWSREFLPPDPLGGLQSGYARQYSLRDAFAVYLAGYLVSCVGFSIPEARKILQDLNGWVKKKVVEPYEASMDVGHPNRSGEGRMDLLIQPAAGSGRPAFTYRIRCRTKRRRLTEGNAGIWQEQYTEETLKPAEPRQGDGYPVCTRWVHLTALADGFFARLGTR